jgi:hypothetical protein
MLAYMQAPFRRVFSSKKTVYLLCELSESGTISQLFPFFNMEIDFFFNSDKVKPINRHVGTENQKKSNYSN